MPSRRSTSYQTKKIDKMRYGKYRQKDTRYKQDENVPQSTGTKMRQGTQTQGLRHNSYCMDHHAVE
ncbi:hypothetical protein M419DRAFT_129096 [Trichoderma reesei RUT C-30]|uniref:Uncharacterized protein n=1 Tax=Hypocrea jecorina (strain ATCC 56765 / BCRC 32924 / NRRL 11460 / Rut C-30) TaxID=1344414 RepID=A0A024SD03_HYPJR|nr:hypothetical protein M419DRAFT_129096 [Trichoderma reesei RUT C-30]